MFLSTGISFSSSKVGLKKGYNTKCINIFMNRGMLKGIISEILMYRNIYQYHKITIILGFSLSDFEQDHVGEDWINSVDS